MMNYIFLTLSLKFESDIGLLKTDIKVEIPLLSIICCCAIGNRLAIVDNAYKQFFWT